MGPVPRREAKCRAKRVPALCRSVPLVCGRWWGSFRPSPQSMPCSRCPSCGPLHAGLEVLGAGEPAEQRAELLRRVAGQPPRPFASGATANRPRDATPTARGSRFASLSSSPPRCPARSCCSSRGERLRRLGGGDRFSGSSSRAAGRHHRCARLSCMEGDSRAVTAALHGCRSEVGVVCCFGYPRSARRALRITARSMTSWKSAPATGGR